MESCATWQEERAASLRVCHNYHTITYTDVYVVYDIYVSNSFFSLSSIVSSSIYVCYIKHRLGCDVWVNWFGGVYKRRKVGKQVIYQRFHGEHIPE